VAVTRIFENKNPEILKKCFKFSKQAKILQFFLISGFL